MYAVKPVTVDGLRFESITAARPALEAKGVSYWRAARALREGRVEINGVRIEQASSRAPDTPKAPRVHKPGEPLLRYPLGESPLERGLPGICH